MATTSKYQIQVGVTGADQAAKKLGGVSRGLGSLAKQAAVAGAAYFSAAGIINGLKASIKLAGEQEQAERQLEKALGKSITGLKAYASAQQKVTTFGDEVTLRAAAQFAQFTKNEEQIKQLLTATQDYAAAQGVDLVSAAQLVAKSFGSSTNALSRYGVEVTGAAGSTERLTSMTENMARMFGGQAAASADTMSGKIEQMKNAIGDAQEEIGKALTPIIVDLAQKTKEFSQDFAEAVKYMRGESGEFSDEAKELAGNIELAADAMKAFIAVSITSSTISGINNLVTGVQGLNTAFKALGSGGALKLFTSIAGGAAIAGGAVALALKATDDAFNEHYENTEKLNILTFENEEQRAEFLAKRQEELTAARDAARAAKVQAAREEAQAEQQAVDEKEAAAAREAAIIANQLAQERQAARDKVAAWRAESDGYAAHRAYMVDQYEMLGRTEYEKRAEWYLKIAQLDESEVERRVAAAKAKQQAETDAMFAAVDGYSVYIGAKLAAQAQSEQEDEWILQLQERNMELAESLGLYTKAQLEEQAVRERGNELIKQGPANLARLNDALKGSAGITKGLMLADKRMKQGAAIMDTYGAANKALNNPPGPPWTIPAMLATVTMGLANVAQIEAQKFARGGDFVTSGPQMIMVGDNPGGRERVQITPTSSPNIEGPRGGGVTINFSGPVTDRDFVRDVIVPEVKRAARYA